MGAMPYVTELEVQRLAKVGVLNKGMNFRINPDADTLLTFCNRLEGRTLFAKISCDYSRSPTEIFGIVVTEQVDGQEAELVSIYWHGSLEHLIRVGKGFLCYHATDRKVIKKAEKTVVTVRVDEELQQAFNAAAAASGESSAVVLRQLMRYFIGKGPDPKIAY